ncbi:helix-turn-helix domain-containing protein [Streptomyces paromomycinus]|uniref:Transcriptional regulator n=1 Tax=Streptomyces paromomycinus TaxID=92743 RepID=A0A401VXG4_STREY|nr:helix-turn-helix transcriptional regulator [Streptomyces paromomycinus]GCD41773.1 transcriptional regulator [Streptomyces paromomycinus]
MPQKPKALDDTQSMAAWFGKELRNWRGVRGLSSNALGSKVHLSGASIVRIEKAERSCTAEVVAEMDKVLGAGGALCRLWCRVEEEIAERRDADKSKTAASGSASEMDGMGILVADPQSIPDGSLSAVERRAFFAVGGLAAVSPATFAHLISQRGTVPLPKTIRPEEIAQLWTASHQLAQWDNLYGGAGMVRRASTGLFAWATELLSVDCPDDRVKKDLFAAVGRLAIVMGASAFDAYEHHNAQGYLRIGTECAERANNWHLRAAALNWRARQAIWLGAPDEGLTYAESGLLRADRLTPRERAMLHNASARALAKMGRIKETLAAIGYSDDAVDKARPGQDAPWMAYYDEAQHHGDTGHALYDLTLIGGHAPQRASERLQTAIDKHTDAYVRSRALSGAKLASLTMATGDPREAAALGMRALDEVGRLNSRRAIDDIRALRRICAQRSRISEVAELRDRIRTTVGT